MKCSMFKLYVNLEPGASPDLLFMGSDSSRDKEIPPKAIYEGPCSREAEYIYKGRSVCKDCLRTAVGFELRLSNTVLKP